MRKSLLILVASVSLVTGSVYGAERETHLEILQSDALAVVQSVVEGLYDLALSIGDVLGDETEGDGPPAGDEFLGQIDPGGEPLDETDGQDEFLGQIDPGG